MSGERARWKITVVLLAASVGVWLGVAGSHAPRLNVTISDLAGPSGAGEPQRASGNPDQRRPGSVRSEERESAFDAGGAPARGAATTRGADANSAPTPGGTDAPRSAAAPVAPAPPAPGPLLSEMWYASRAHELYPTMTLAPNDQILTGFQVRFRAADGANETVTVTSPDQTSQSATFSRADRLYFVETRLGDDGVDGETNGGDDGFILTDAQGHILGR